MAPQRDITQSFQLSQSHSDPAIIMSVAAPIQFSLDAIVFVVVRVF